MPLTDPSICVRTGLLLLATSGLTSCGDIPGSDLSESTPLSESGTRESTVPRMGNYEVVLKLATGAAG